VIRSTKDHVTIMDFAPFNETFTSSLAFDWKQLQEDEAISTSTDEPDDPEFRYLANDVGIQPTSRNNYGIPHDVVNMFKASSIADEDLSRLVIDELQEETRLQRE
jgi:hypothetical protein